MKSVSVLLLFFAFIQSIVIAQQGGWEKFYTQNGARRAHDIKPTSDGGYIMTGFSNLTNSFFGQDVMLMKIDGNGDYDWSVNFDASNSTDIGNKMIQNYGDGFAIVANASTPDSFNGDGYFILTDAQGSLIKQDFFGGNPTGDRLEGIIQLPSDSGYVLVGTSGHPYLVRTDKHGDTLYTKRFTDITGVFQAVTCSEDGEFLYLAGTAVPLQNAGLLLKVNLFGDIVWETIYELGHDDFYNIIQQNNDIYVVGRTLESDLNGQPLCMIRKFNEFDGQMDFYKTFDRGAFRSFVSSEDGGFVIAGRNVFQGNGTLQERVYVVKTDSEGELIWEREFGQNYPASNLGWGICKGHDYGYLVCGQFTSADGIPYVYVIKIDENGSVVSTNSFPFLPEISLYPNPCSEVLNIQLGTFESEKRITVFNNAGQEVYHLATLDNEVQINEVGFWQSGVYLVHVEVEGHKVVRKVVVDY